jgi:hypothetical protein
MAMMAMTTSSSIKVKPWARRQWGSKCFVIVFVPQDRARVRNSDSTDGQACRGFFGGGGGRTTGALPDGSRGPGLSRVAPWTPGFPCRFSGLRSGRFNSASCPRREFFPVFQHVGRHLKIMDRRGAPRLFINERPHASLNVSSARPRIGFEIESSLHQNAEEMVGLIQTMSAEHGFDTQFRERAQLIQDEVFERFSSHDTWRMPLAGAEIQDSFKHGSVDEVVGATRFWSTRLRVLSRRDCAVQPRVARNELPWECSNVANPNGVAPIWIGRATTLFRNLSKSPIGGRSAEHCSARTAGHRAEQCSALRISYAFAEISFRVVHVSASSPPG